MTVAKFPHRHPDLDVIQAVNAVMVDAKAGRIRGIAIVVDRAEGGIAHMHVAGTVSPTMLGHATLMLKHLAEAADHGRDR